MPLTIRYIPREECTGISASWCPNCGTCTCPKNEDGAMMVRWVPCAYRDHLGFTYQSSRPECVHDPKCPLHGEESTHA